MSGRQREGKEEEGKEGRCQRRTSGRSASTCTSP